MRFTKLDVLCGGSAPEGKKKAPPERGTSSNNGVHPQGSRRARDSIIRQARRRRRSRLRLTNYSPPDQPPAAATSVSPAQRARVRGRPAISLPPRLRPPRTAVQQQRSARRRAPSREWRTHSPPARQQPQIGPGTRRCARVPPPTAKPAMRRDPHCGRRRQSRPAECRATKGRGGEAPELGEPASFVRRLARIAP